MANQNSRPELGTLESWLWEAACVIRGPIDAPKFKNYIICLNLNSWETNKIKFRINAHGIQ